MRWLRWLVTAVRQWQFVLHARGRTVLAWRRWGKQRRLTVGPFEFAHGKGIPLDVLTPWGSLLTVTMSRTPATSVATAKRKIADGKSTCRWVLANNRLVFLGLGGSNVFEAAVWHRWLVTSWFTDDMRIVRWRDPRTPADVFAEAPTAVEPPPAP